MRSRRQYPRLLVATGVVFVLAIGVTSCSSDPPQRPYAGSGASADPQLGVDPTVPVEEGELPEAGPTDLADLGEDALGLALGDEYVVGGNHTTLLEVRRPLPSYGDDPGPGPGREWVGARVSTCFESELDRQLEIGSYLFSAVSEHSISYPGVQPEDAGWPVPQYPGYGRLAPGQCTSGWIAIPVPVGATLTSIVQSAVTTDPVSEWTVPTDAW
ncbi:hypothetical protein D0Z08_31110 [Nocardioides immobilis]|uniref:DUF4352 domain-containing protein n=1 Tax=Nocardioides immobilis TaxID=2049295 RepID=A0A417XRT6_9ACTN|nr:hypothetical protein [Nocardioides immobilis]RHW22793.1 hypothetical protein D0Z08_31110 [Nocardioides immobilis]